MECRNHDTEVATPRFVEKVQEEEATSQTLRTRSEEPVAKKAGKPKRKLSKVEHWRKIVKKTLETF